MHKTKSFYALLALLLASLACAIPNPLAGGGSDGSSAAGGVLFSDDFGSTDTGWEVGDYQTGSVGYGSGVYFVRALGNGDTMWGQASRSFTDVHIEVDAAQIEAPSNDNNDYGVICRLQSDGSGYYLLISGDGFYSILMGTQGGFEQLVDWTTSNLIRQGNTSNHITAICQGSNLSLYVNGDLLATATDSTFSTGDIGLTATSYESTSTLVHFYNLVVSQP